MKNQLLTVQFVLIFGSFANLLSAQSATLKLNLSDLVRGAGGSIELSNGGRFSMAGEYQYLRFYRQRLKNDWLSGGKSYESRLDMNGWRSSLFLRYYPQSVHKGFFTEGGAYLGHYKGEFTDYKYPNLSHGSSSGYTDFNERVRGLRFGIGTQIRKKVMLLELSGGVSLNFNKLNNKITPFANDANYYIRAAWGFVASKTKRARKSGKYIWFTGE